MRSVRVGTVAALVSVFIVAVQGGGGAASADTSAPTSVLPSSSSPSSTVNMSTIVPPGVSPGQMIGVTSTTNVMSESAASNLDELPIATESWGPCLTSSQTYCYEPVTLLNKDGTENQVLGGSPSTNCHDNANAKVTCKTDGSFWLEVGLGREFLASDVENTYHWAIRTGRFSPDIMMLGNTQKTRVNGSAATGWRLEIWAKPALKAYKNGCYTAQMCGENTVAESVGYRLSGYVRTLAIGTGLTVPGVANSELRDALRGTFITTNGMSQAWDFKSETFMVKAISPHFLTDGVTVGPGYVRVFLPSAYVLGTKGYKRLSEVNARNIALRVASKDATASVTVLDNGIMVDTGITHFSEVDPEIQLLPRGETVTTPAVLLETTPVATTPAVKASLTLKTGASKSLLSIYRAKASQKAKWTASGACSVKGTRLVARTRAGTCTVTVRILNAKKAYVVAARKTYTVT